jgi:hypothetical protein
MTRTGGRCGRNKCQPQITAPTASKLRVRRIMPRFLLERFAARTSVTGFSGNSDPGLLGVSSGRTRLRRSSPLEPEGRSVNAADAPAEFQISHQTLNRRFSLIPTLGLGAAISPTPCHLLASDADSGYIPSLIYRPRFHPARAGWGRFLFATQTRWKHL